MLTSGCARGGVLAALALIAAGTAAQTAAWTHLQIAGVSNQVCSISITMGSQVYTLENIPLETTAGQICRDLAREVNSARHGHVLFATCNGVDGSILSLVADGSPTSNSTPWLGRLVPLPDIEITPGSCGIQVRRTNIQDTLVAIDIEGEQAEVSEGQISLKLNGTEFALNIESDDPQGTQLSADRIAAQLAEMINRDDGFRASALRDDTGQLKIFIAGENLGGGVRIDSGPTSLAGIKLKKAQTLFASQAIYAGTGSANPERRFLRP
jgi:hypothetical protein